MPISCRGMVWRALAILAEAGTVTEQTVSQGASPEVRRRRHSAAGPGIRWRSFPSGCVRHVRAAGRQPRQPPLAHPTRPLAPARGRAAGLRARLRGGRSRTWRGDQGLYHRRPRGMTDFTPSTRAGRGHPRDQGLVREPDRRAAGLPDVRLCRFRKEHRAALRPRRARPRRRTRASATAAACPAWSPPPSPARRPTC